MKKNNYIALTIIVLLMVTIMLILNLHQYNKEPIIESIRYENKFNEDKTRKVILNIKKYNMNNVYCQFINDEKSSNWILAKDDKCSYNVKTFTYKINIKYNGNKIVTYNQDFNIDGIANVKITNKKKYVALNDSFNIDAKLDYIGDVDTSIKYKSSNPNIISIDENGNINALKKGTSKISVYSSNKMSDEVEVIVTDLIRPAFLDNNKEKVPCNFYSEEDIKILDDILKSRVDEAGVGTRGATAVVARFLTLEFPFKIPYFYENGRITGNTVEGEGRYYKKGLYLGQTKENEIKTRMAGPASWGCPLMNYEDDGYRKPNTLYPNGLDCSGYVSWILYNAGLDLGDIGAGASDEYDYTDVGELNYNSYDLLHSGRVKVGDLIGWDGHIAVIGAMSDTKIYVTESLLPGVIMDEYDYSSPYSNFYSRYDYIIDMTNNYKGDGNLKKMW